MFFNHKLVNKLTIVGLFLLPVILFLDVFFDKYPVTSADPAIKYWSAVYNSQNISNGNFTLWNKNAGVGQSVFFSSILHSPFSALAIFLSFFENKAFGISIFLWAQFLFFVITLGTLIKRRLNLSSAAIFAIAIISIFSPANLNEYLFNGFSGYLLFPLMLHLFYKANSGNGDYYYSACLGTVLAIANWLSNESVTQYSLIFFGFMSLYLWIDSTKLLLSFWRVVKFMIIATLVWLGLMAFWLFPFGVELTSLERSHIYSNSSGDSLFTILKSLVGPFTSWTFIDEKMITTGLLTRWESMGYFVSMLLAPSLIYFLLNRKSFKKIERFFFYYALGYLFLSWLNRYIPILGFIVTITKSTSWWRSYPLFIFSSAISIGIVINHLFNNINEVEKKINSLLLKITTYFSFLYLIAGSLILTLFLLWSFFPDIFLSFLKLFSIRPKEEILKYFDYYYFTIPVIFWILIIPFSSFLILWIWTRAYVSKGNLSNNWPILFIIALLLLHLSLVHVYYPMNSGINKNDLLSESDFIKQLSTDDRIFIVETEHNIIEEKYGTATDLSNAIQLAKVPDYSRYQSSINFRGNYFTTLETAGIYSMGSNLTPNNLSDFHSAVLNNDERRKTKYKYKKGYLRAGVESVKSPLIDVASISYIMASMPIIDKDLQLVHEGDQYFIYKNVSSFPKFFLAAEELLNDIYENELPLFAKQNFYEPNKMLGTIKANESKFYHFEVDSSSDSVLVINDLFHDDWTATLDGMPIEIFPVNYIFKGVRIPKGSHQLELIFKPNGLIAGISLSFATLIIILFIFFRRRVL